ncbi:hypothetical protein EWM64_g4997 [Hericium alpestre]|uniref:Uncharacterized protein n=1 Tax=Hericium alpestre TaxID=135208 RepID=A0A4Y9ZVW2_9AGAM|nr:hypothetical protein EWM64_g4997 [Hericium alpestre]
MSTHGQFFDSVDHTADGRMHDTAGRFLEAAPAASIVDPFCDAQLQHLDVWAAIRDLLKEGLADLRERGEL